MTFPRTIGLILLCALCAGRPALADGGETSEARLLEMSRELVAEVERLRGWKFKRPVTVEVYSEAQLREHLLMMIQREYGDGRLERLGAYMRLIGLLPPDVNLREKTMELLLNQVGGFYDPTDKKLRLLKREGVDYGELMNSVLIAHELTHALDDQHTPLTELYHNASKSEDYGMAISAVIEGSATVLMTRYMLEKMTSGDFEDEKLAELMASEMKRSEPLMTAPPYFRTLVANYMCGMAFLTKNDPTVMAGWASGNGQGVGEQMLAATRDPPVSTEQILHPEKYWEKEKRDAPVEFDDGPIVAALEKLGGFVTHTDTLGELLCATVTTDEQLPFDMMGAGMLAAWTNQASTGWGGDRLFMLVDGKDRETALKEFTNPRVLWITAWDTPTDREEFMKEYVFQRELAGRRESTLGDRVAIYSFGLTQVQHDDLLKTLERGALRAKRAGRAWPVSER
ncbi:hypothetical protein YTPLAS18_12570 [Nitrospira sp.]|nr:hypothetical protein YTPLAS18_12570 [Nitrospira sp.]